MKNLTKTQIKKLESFILEAQNLETGGMGFYDSELDKLEKSSKKENVSSEDISDSMQEVLNAANDLPWLNDKDKEIISNLDKIYQKF